MKTTVFQAGFTQRDADFFIALFAILIHAAGINLAMFPRPILRGRVGQGTPAVGVLRALERGASMKVDLGSGWDFWDYVEMPIDAARERLGVPRLIAITVSSWASPSSLYPRLVLDISIRRIKAASSQAGGCTVLERVNGRLRFQDFPVGDKKTLEHRHIPLPMTR